MNSMLRVSSTHVSLALVLATALCAAHAAAQDAPKAAAPMLESRLNLLQRLPVARIGLDDASRESIPLDSADHFAGGWYQPGQTEDGRLYRWMGPRAAVVDLALVEAEDLKVSIGVTTPRDERIPPMRVRFHWNGAFAGNIDLNGDAQTLVMNVPAELTRPGMNRLELVPSFWVNASKLAGGSSATNVSVNVFQLSIARSETAPKRVRATYPLRQADDAVVQRANTVVTYATRLDEGATLSIAGEWPGQNGVAEPAEALVLVRDSRGRTETAFRADSASNDAPFETTYDLGAFAGEFVEISTILRQTTAARTQPRPVMWRKLAVNGPETSVELPRSTPARGVDRPNVVLVVFDALRADFTEPYGATDVRTPNFARLAERGVTFSNAFAHTSWTRPSIATLMTSLHETRHGTITIEDKLAASVAYLPELMRSSGYNTIGVSMNGHISRQSGFDRGFNAFHELGMRHEQMLSANPTPQAYLDKIWDEHIAPAAAQSSAPFFLYLHELDPHGPYTPRPPFDAMYPTAYTGRPQIEADHINLVRLGLTELDPQDIAYLAARYRGEVSFVDGVLGAIMDRLERDGLADNTVLIVTADHGEEFGEHGGIGHMVTLHDEVLRVPMLWSWPGHVRSGRDDSAVGLIDLAPTLLELLGVARPPAMEGRDRSAALLADRAAVHYPVLAQMGANPERIRRAMYWAGWRLCTRDFGAEIAYELFDTVHDPGEITDQWVVQREVGLALRQMMDWYGHSTAHIGAATTEKLRMESIDPEAAEQLRNLGYVQ